jgi:hypothetical protein
LDWSIASCANHEKLDRHILSRVVWETLTVDMGHIRNEADVVKFIRRLYMVVACGLYEVEDLLTVEQVRPFIGLTTNVVTTTDAAFKKKCMALLERKVRERVP